MLARQQTNCVLSFKLRFAVNEMLHQRRFTVFMTLSACLIFVKTAICLNSKKEKTNQNSVGE